MKEHFSDEQYKAYKKNRGDWGEVKPYTRIFDDGRKRAQSRKPKHKINAHNYDDYSDED